MQESKDLQLHEALTHSDQKKTKALQEHKLFATSHISSDFLQTGTHINVYESYGFKTVQVFSYAAPEKLVTNFLSNIECNTILIPLPHLLLHTSRKILNIFFDKNGIIHYLKEISVNLKESCSFLL